MVVSGCAEKRPDEVLGEPELGHVGIGTRRPSGLAGAAPGAHSRPQSSVLHRMKNAFH